MIRLLQFSDTHLYADSAETFRAAINPEKTLTGLIDTVVRGRWRPDCALVTGDLVHDGSVAGYERLRAHFARLAIPVHCLAGNHDDSATMSGILAQGAVSVARAVRYGAWQLILLDSTIAGEAGGRLADAELEYLEAQLSAHPERHALIALHHPPLPCGSRWMDVAMSLANPADLFTVTDRHAQVRAIVWGHIHQGFSAVRRGVYCLGAPSTMVQFVRGSASFALDDAPPACRWFELYDDGAIQTGMWMSGEELPRPMAVAETEISA
jgi:Icc protein